MTERKSTSAIFRTVTTSFTSWNFFLVTVTDLPEKKFHFSKEVITALKGKYSKPEVSAGKVYPYIGMVFDLTSANVSIHQNIRVAAFFFLRTT